MAWQSPCKTRDVMRLDEMLDRCRRLEERASAVYRAYAASSRTDPVLCALWTSLAREEEGHADGIALVQSRPASRADSLTRLDGWTEALATVEQRLTVAERLEPGATTNRQLSAALELEMTELEALRQVLLAASGQAEIDCGSRTRGAAGGRRGQAVERSPRPAAGGAPAHPCPAPAALSDAWDCLEYLLSSS